MINKKVIALACFSFLLTSCTLFSPVQNQGNASYQLKNTPSVHTKNTKAYTLLVTTPETNAMYNNNQIAYTQNPYQISYYAKSYWADTPANMIQQLMIQTLQNTHFYHAIIPQANMGRYDYILNSQLLELEQDFLVSPTRERFKFSIQLVRAADNHVMATKQFSVSIPTHQNNAYGAVIAANKAVSIGLLQMTNFLIYS